MHHCLTKASGCGRFGHDLCPYTQHPRKRRRFHDQDAIKHVVVIFQENVSFDHYFGTYPHAKANNERH